ncbi:MAG TPA: hypothetical protein VEZ71_21055 [Archangium sp.]|nr:hypothetical protein [Archangium sp.]
MAKQKRQVTPRKDDGPPAPLPTYRQATDTGTYVRCGECRGLRMPGGVHAPTHVTNPPLPWPQCAHGVAYMQDCKSNAVPPPCCRGAE